MWRRILYFTAFVVIFGIGLWCVLEIKGLREEIGILSEKLQKKNQVIQKSASSGVSGKESYNVTIDMWQIFEKELQDYKQRLREGKQQFNEQYSQWNDILVKLNKNLQEYDKFIAAEGEFWEKQLKGYDKLFVKTEQRFEILGQLIGELGLVIDDLQSLWEMAVEDIKSVEQREEQFYEEEKRMEAQSIRKPKVIKPKIRSRQQYDTYPKQEESDESGEAEEGPEGEVIRGKISGSGRYQTY